MTEFFNVLPPDDARQLLLSHIDSPLPQEMLETANAVGRVTAGSIPAPHALPAFRRSTMDGYAVRAKDTFGASGSLPAFLSVIGEVEMGKPADVTINVGQAAIVHTGGMLPDTADGVIPVELTQIIGEGNIAFPPHEIEAFKSVAPGENVLQVGEDIHHGEIILSGGHLLRPQDIGGLLALGITQIPVRRRPVVAILATGDEVISPEESPTPGQIRDINSYTIGGQVIRAGGIPLYGGIAPDNRVDLQKAAFNALTNADMVVMSAGSSVSVRDITVEVIEELGEPGVLFHGVATRPGKPTIAGVADGKPVIGLPGNPVSAMVQFNMFGVPAIHNLQGIKTTPYQGVVWATLDQNIASESGREDYVPAKLTESNNGLIATPVFGKSNLIYTLVNADGLIKVPLNKGGLLKDDLVVVQIF